MKLILTGIKIVIVAILSLFYWPLNTFFLWFQKHHRKWQKEDRVSYFLSIPLYYLLFLITAIISVPLETMGESFHPPLSKFR